MPALFDVLALSSLAPNFPVPGLQGLLAPSSLAQNCLAPSFPVGWCSPPRPPGPQLLGAKLPGGVVPGFPDLSAWLPGSASNGTYGASNYLGNDGDLGMQFFRIRTPLKIPLRTSEC